MCRLFVIKLSRALHVRLFVLAFMEKVENSKVFQKLKPLCIKVLRTPCQQAIKELNYSINELSSIDPKLLEYVIFPLRVTIKQQNLVDSDPVLVEHLLACITSVVSKSTIISRDLFEELYRLSCILLDEKLIQQRFKNLSYTEDNIFIALKLLLTILQNCSDDIKLAQLSGGEQLQVIGHCISVLLSVIKHQSSRDVQLIAINCLTALSGMRVALLSLIPVVTIDTNHSNVSWVNNIATIGSGLAGASKTFSSFLPGIVVSLCELVTKNSKAGQKVVSCGLLAWVHFVSLVMNDKEYSAIVTVNDEGNCEHKTQLEVKRDKKWWKETSQKLDILVTRMCQLISHSSWLVRWSLCVWSYCLLTYTSSALSVSSSKCIEVLVALQSDTILAVSSASSVLLQLFSDQFVSSNSRNLISVFEENIFELCSKLSKTLLSHGDEQKLCTLNLLLGYVKLLGPHVNRLTYSISHLKAFCSGFVECLQLELNDIRIMEEQQVNEYQDGLLAWKLPLRFVNFQNEAILHCIEQICLLIGCHVELEPVIDQLMDMFRLSEVHSKESTLVIKSILVGAAGTSSPMTLDRHNLVVQLVKEIVAEFITPAHWRCKTSSSSEEGPSSQKDVTLSFTQLNSNILLVCLLVQSVGTFAQVVGGDFEPLLQTAIYPLLEKLGDRNAMISHCAYHSLSLIAHHCGYASISDLITANADYLVNAVSLNLRCILVHPEAPSVLKAVLLHGNARVLPLMQDSIDEVMFALDVHQEKEHAFWPILLALVKAIVKWFPNEEQQPTCAPAPCAKSRPSVHSSNESCYDASHDDVKEFFINYHKQKHQQELQEDEDEMQEDSSTSDDKTEQSKKVLPGHYQAAIEVLKRCTYFVATNTLKTKLIVLDAIVLCLRALQDVQDELLPQVHKLWPAFTRRFGESNPLVVLKAAEVLVTMADVCRDFLRRRVSKEVWPLLMNKLEQSASTSCTAGSSYQHTSSYKLQKFLLDNAAMLANTLEMTADDHEKLAHACIPYLDCHQPVELQAKCRACLEKLAVCHADMLWLLLQQIRSDHIVQPPHVFLKPYKFPPHQTAVDYQNNVGLLLELIA